MHRHAYEHARARAHTHTLTQLQSSSATGISWLDKFGDKMESLANDLDRSVSKMSTTLNKMQVCVCLSVCLFTP